MHKATAVLLLLVPYLALSSPVDSPRGPLIPYNGERIVGGELTEPGEYPYLLALTIDLFTFCGGTLIAPDLVLTAAHCLDFGARNVVALAGAYDMSVDEPSQQTRQSSYLLQHPQWNRTFGEYDIALVYLSEPFELTDRVQLSTLATGAAPAAGTLATAAGRGLTSDESNAASDVPYDVIVPVIPNDVAADDDDLPDRFTFSTVICVDTSGGRGTCSGDSGGPLLQTDTGEQIGVTSYGGSACETGTPACFTDVAMFQDWIAENQVPPV